MFFNEDEIESGDEPFQQHNPEFWESRRQQVAKSRAKLRDAAKQSGERVETDCGVFEGEWEGPEPDPSHVAKAGVEIDEGGILAKLAAEYGSDSPCRDDDKR